MKFSKKNEDGIRSSSIPIMSSPRKKHLFWFVNKQQQILSLIYSLNTSGALNFIKIIKVKSAKNKTIMI